MSLKNTKTTPPESIQDFPIVGIGASAGGLDAFKRFLKAIPANSGMAYVLVQHLDPTHESILPEILAKVTTIPVNEIIDDIHLAPNNIYVIPQNKTLKSTDGVLKLTPREKIVPNLPIDVFFISLAEVHLNLAVGVVLSGNGKDGTLGLAAIKEHGGITFAQDEESSSYEGMPQSAIHAEVVDYILAPEKIPQKLLEISKSGKSLAKKIPKNEEGVFKRIILILRQRSGVDFSNYKQTTVHRRILRRMEISKKEKLADYLKILIKDRAEQDLLFQDMLIPVTTFFRDSDMFQIIGEKVLPTFLKNKLATEPIRMWVAGFSTGEEAYSFAILLHEHLGKKISGRQIQIFASDISEQAISKARTGIYSKAELKNVSDNLLKCYFKKTNEGYQINRQIRDMCVFAVHNFLKDPPFAKMGLISCRNVLIYMDAFLQKKALSTFNYALKDTGFLFLGKSETTGAESELFTPFAKMAKIYTRKAASNRYIHTAKIVANNVLQVKDKKIVLPEIQQTDFRKLTDSMLLSDFTPAGVVINEQMDIVHIHGVITPFLEPSQGKPSFNLLKMAREGLAFELRNTLHKAKSTQTTVTKKGIPAKINGRNYLVTITIIPLPNTNDSHFLILFRKTLVVKNTNKNGDPLSKKASDDEILQRIGLEKELAQTREDMRVITEEQEAANEELQSANEELLSSSEELQSLNEELETSKEETQSSNEELMIVNQELLDKQEQINSSRMYAEAVINTINEPLVILDDTLRIKTANNSFYTKFNITEQESDGELIYEMHNGLFGNTLLKSLLEKILPKRTQLKDYEIIIDLPPHGEYTLLLNARQIVNEKIKEQLILIAIEDISERKILEKRKKKFSEELESKVKERTLQLEQINLQLDQFTHTTSHEFQEPLRKIATFSKILQDSKNKLKPELIHEYLNKIEGASIRMTKLTQDMLNFAGIASHEKLFIKTDLNEILKNILFDFELLIEEKKAKIICGKLPEIEAVPFQMNQLFYDIIHNALKFSKRDVSPIIEISSHKLSKEEIKDRPKLNQKLNYYEIIFKDNGIGFDQKYARQIFTMFQRLSSGGIYPGTGIGLALSKKIVQTYSGKIFAQGKDNKGASFHVILPIEQPVSESSEDVADDA